MLDVDHFKQVNDRHGHQVGDRALRAIAATIARNVRAYDIVGRWGGEEMLIILPGAGGADAAVVAERIRAAIASTPLELDAGAQLALTASLGIASADANDDRSFDALVHLADMGLYQAKSSGRNQVVLVADVPSAV